jgi:hypothetical protein
MDLSAHRQQVAQGLKGLEASIALFTDALAHSKALIQVDEPENGVSAIRRCCEAYSTIDYRMDDEVGASTTCLGVIGTTAEILRRAKAVNAAKARFKAICTPLQHIRTRIPVKGETSSTKALPVIRVVLRNIQRSDLNLLAAYRKIPLLDAPPASITYTRANTRAVYRRSIDEIIEILNRLNSPAAAADHARLAILDRGETHLAVVKQHYQNVRANVLYAHLDPRGRGRMQISAELPLLYSKGRLAGAPEVHFPPAGEMSGVLQRKRQPKLEPARFLQSISAYRYAAAMR